MPSLELKESHTARRWVLVAWPAFLAACLLEALVFSMVDPGEVHWPGQVSQISRQGIYSVAFFCFWLISAASSYLLIWLAGAEGLNIAKRPVNDSAAVD